MIQAIIFDFGNVVGFFDHRITTRRLVEHSPLPFETLHAALYGGPLEEAYEAGRLTSAEFVRRALEAGQFRPSCTEAVFSQAWAEIFRPNPEVCALIPRLRPRYRLLLGSNTNELHARQFLGQFADTFRHLDHLVLSHEAGARKPDPEFFRHCLRLANCRPEECVMIDDLPANVAGATACGLRGIVYRGYEDLRERLGELGVEDGPHGHAT